MQEEDGRRKEMKKKRRRDASSDLGCDDKDQKKKKSRQKFIAISVDSDDADMGEKKWRRGRWSEKTRGHKQMGYHPSCCITCKAAKSAEAVQDEEGTCCSQHC